MTRKPVFIDADPDPQIQALQRGRLDFSGALLVATRLVREIARAPAAAECRQLATLAAALDRPDYQRRKQAYFRYPNSPAGMNRLPPGRVVEILGRCARLLGQALARDVVHTAAPIPVFHNRIQQHRRTDGGVYDWPRAGRLDRWLHSCRYPNLAQSGLRDFEHFLTDRGVTREEAAAMPQGEADIVLATGPHLGGFNQSISLPELIRMTGAVAADGIACRFRRERGWPASGRWKDQVVEDQPPESRPGGAVESPAQMG